MKRKRCHNRKCLQGSVDVHRGLSSGISICKFSLHCVLHCTTKGIPVTFSKTSRNRCLYQVAKKGIVVRQPRPKIYSNFLFPLLALPTLPSRFFFPFREMNFPEKFNGVLCNETSQGFIGLWHNHICDH